MTKGCWTPGSTSNGECTSESSQPKELSWEPFQLNFLSWTGSCSPYDSLPSPPSLAEGLLHCNGYLKRHQSFQKLPIDAAGKSCLRWGWRNAKKLQAAIQLCYKTLYSCHGSPFPPFCPSPCWELLSYDACDKAGWRRQHRGIGWEGSSWTITSGSLPRQAITSEQNPARRWGKGFLCITGGIGSSQDSLFPCRSLPSTPPSFHPSFLRMPVCQLHAAPE